MAEKGISHMIYCWSEGVFKCWVICQTQLRSEAGQGCSQNLRSVFGQQTRLKLREHPSLRQTLFILFPFIRFSSLWRAFAAVDSSVYGIWNVTLSPQSLCAFVPVNQFTLATTGIPKTRRMWYLSKSPGFIKAVIPLCNDVIHIQVELLVYAFFFLFYQYILKLNHERLVKTDHSPSSDKQAAFNMQMVEKRRHTATKKPQRYPVLGQCCRYT